MPTQPPADPASSQPNSTPTWFWPVIVTIAAIVLVGLVLVVLMYVTWKHPSTAGPIGIAIAAVAAFAALAAVLVALHRR
ncbi:hypothetical protein ACFU8I_18030 [Streptomyces sp. NPDC057540]|uniref:hypothetical protein n=1 Tax=Streptomyces sp. NPDC057540 TaxID=3346160 RepID=UPI0036B3A314